MPLLQPSLRLAPRSRTTTLRSLSTTLLHSRSPRATTATTTPSPPSPHRAASTISVTSTRSNASAPLLANIEASWKDLPVEEQYEVYQQLEELQKKNWNELTTDEKKAAYYVAFGPHGPRSPALPAGNGVRVTIWTLVCMGLGMGLFEFIRSFAAPPPKTMTKEYKDAETEYMRGQKMNPISGIGSEDYKGKGMAGSL